MKRPPYGPPTNCGRVLIAFLNDNNEAVWSEIMPLKDMEMQIGAHEIPTLTLEVAYMSLDPK